jgi:hypothetical protein
MSLLNNLKKIKDTAVKKIKSVFTPKPTSGSGGGSWGPTTTTPPKPKTPVTWGLGGIDTSYKAPNLNVGQTTPKIGTTVKKGIIMPTSPSGDGLMSRDPSNGTGIMSVAPTASNKKSASSGGGKVGGGAGGGGGGSTKSSSSTSSSISSYSSLADIGLGFSTADIGSGSGSGSVTQTTGSKTGSASTGGGGAGGSSSIADQLSALEAEGRRLQEELNKMLNQSQTAADGAVSSDTEEVNYEKEALKKLKEAGLMPDDSGLKLLNDELKQLRQNEKDNLSNINAGYDVQQTGMQNAQLGETGQTSMAIANAGGYLGFSGSGTGVMLKLAESHRAELVSLESQRQNALQEARNAAAERRFDIVRLKADEIARLDQEKYERVQEYNAEVKKQAEADLTRAKTIKREEDIMNAIMAGNTSVEDIYKAMGGGATVEEIRGVLDNVTKKSTIAGGFKISSTNVGKLLGAGMTQDDVNALQEYVNENGYDEKVRSQLTPAQAAVADKIFNLTGTGGPSTKVMGLLDLGRVEEQYGVTFPYGVTTGEVEQFIQDNWGKDSNEMQDAIDLLFGKQTSTKTSVSSTVNEGYLRDNYTAAELQNLAAKTGAASMWKPGATDVANMFSNTVYMTKLQKLINVLVNEEGYSLEDALDQLVK